MITENLDVENGICNGTTGYISDIKKINKKVIVEVLLKNNKIINISTQILTLEKIKINDILYTITHEFMPIKQCSIIIIHKTDAAFNEKAGK